MRAARIENGLVADVWEVPSLDCFGAECLLIEVPASVQVGSTYSAETGFALSVAQQAAAQDQLIARFTTQIQERLDDFARTRLYDNMTSLSKYSDLTDAEIDSLPQQDRAAVTRYRAECRYLLLKTAQTWAVSERIQQQVQANQRLMPTDIADIEADLPTLVWPA